MFITYRRTGSALGLMAVGLAVMTVTVAVAAIAAMVLAPVALLARAMRPASRRSRQAPSPWPHETIEAEVVSATRSSDARDLLRLDTDKG